jgi:phosphoglycerate dehydrogenase-like enzyme
MNILIASPIDPDSIARLERDHDVIRAFGAGEQELRSLIRDRDAVIFRSGVTISGDVMRCAPNLKLLVRAGSGIDNLDLDYVLEHNLTLVRIPEPGARAVAELTFGLMLALARNIVRADGLWRGGRWAKNELTGFLLRDKVLGIVGAGSIGTEVGRLGVAWGMKAIGCVEQSAAPAASRLRNDGIRLTDFDEVIASADFLCIHVPLQPSTRNLIDAAVMARMKASSFLLNLARGGVVDEAALRDALVSGRLCGAALDVHAAEGNGRISPLADLPNVVLTPHIGATTVDTQREIGARIVAACTEFCRENLQRGVSQLYTDFPSISPNGEHAFLDAMESIAKHPSRKKVS